VWLSLCTEHTDVFSIAIFLLLFELHCDVWFRRWSNKDIALQIAKKIYTNIWKICAIVSHYSSCFVVIVQILLLFYNKFYFSENGCCKTGKDDPHALEILLIFVKTRYIKDQYNVFLSNEGDILGRWREFFKDLCHFFSESRDPECPSKVCRDKSCWLHPR